MTNSIKSLNIIKLLTLKRDGIIYIVKIIFLLFLYYTSSYWLHSITITAPSDPFEHSNIFFWVLIVIQTLLFITIFYSSYKRAKAWGLETKLGIFIFTAYAILCGVDTPRSLLLLPLFTITMIVLTFRFKNVVLKLQPKGSK
jgi:hypothetical protein